MGGSRDHYARCPQILHHYHRQSCSEKQKPKTRKQENKKTRGIIIHWFVLEFERLIGPNEKKGIDRWTV